MVKIYIFGLGKGKAFVDRCLLMENVDLLGFIDNYRIDIKEIEGKPIVKQDELAENYDYIVVSLMQYETTRVELIAQGVDESKIICFFDFRDAGEETYWGILDSFKWRMELMWRHYINITIPTLDNLNYELYGETEEIQQQCPKIISIDKTAEILIKERKSLARFGDNEFELMLGRVRTNYQLVDYNLAKRLKEVLNSQYNSILIAIADNYGKLDKYTDDAIKNIRSYLTKDVRKEHMELLDLDREYYDAYISRPYILYRNKKSAGKRFDNVRKIWSNQNVLVVEGEYTRFGVGNNLLDNAAQVSRILVPSKNSFSRYDEIIDEVRMQGRGKLILAILGPTATVMAYDLSKEGYWIIDIGQFDVEYEWYLRGVMERCDIPYKCVSEVMQYDEIVTNDEDQFIQKYKSEVVARIL